MWHIFQPEKNCDKKRNFHWTRLVLGIILNNTAFERKDYNILVRAMESFQKKLPLNKVTLGVILNNTAFERKDYNILVRQWRAFRRNFHWTRLLLGVILNDTAFEEEKGLQYFSQGNGELSVTADIGVHMHPPTASAAIPERQPPPSALLGRCHHDITREELFQTKHGKRL